MILAATADAERRFDTLGEAVAAAASGDTVEIRGHGYVVKQWPEPGNALEENRKLLLSLQG